MKRDLFEQENLVNPDAANDYFGVYHKNFLYYLSNNVDATVIRHEIYKGSKSHFEIPGSKIPNSHLLGMYNVVKLFNSNTIALSGRYTCVKGPCMCVIILILNDRKCARSEAWQLFLGFRWI